MDLIIFVANDNIKRAGGFVQVLEVEDEGIMYAGLVEAATIGDRAGNLICKAQHGVARTVLCEDP